MFWKKKKELTEEQKTTLARLETIKEYVRQLQSDLNYGIISQIQYEVRMHPILIEIAEFERIMGVDYEQQFDEMMGHPMAWMEDLFHTDKAGKEIEDDGE